MPGTESVRVVVRVRPLGASELTRGNTSILDVDRSNGQVMLFNNRTVPPKVFAFDAVYGPDTDQQLIYDETAFPLIENILEGYNGTIFAYGQTGCGKTFTMSGTPEHPGIIPNSFKHIFSAISDTGADRVFLVRCSFIEIYNEEIRDLLKYDPKTKLELKEKPDSGVYIKGLQKELVNNVSDIMRLMDQGASHRTTKETMMNEHSSRSHSIFTVYVEMTENREDGAHLKAGKLNLVDLAGSERQKKTQAEGDRLKEAIEINLSLSALGNVISALVDGRSSHIPYRDSKLTRLLQDSLGGNTKTIMIAVASPADYNYDESLSTLRYASRAKFIQNRPTINEDPKDALLRQYLETINKLRKELEGQEVEVKYVEKIVYVEEDEEGSVRLDPPAKAKEQPRGKGKAAAKQPAPTRGTAPTQGEDTRGTRDIARHVELENDSEDDSPNSARKTVNTALNLEGKMAKPKPSKQPNAVLEDDSSSEEIQSKPSANSRVKPPKATVEDSAGRRRQGALRVKLEDSDAEKDTAPKRKAKHRTPTLPETGLSTLEEGKTHIKQQRKHETTRDKGLTSSKAQLAADYEDDYSDEFLPEESQAGLSSPSKPAESKENPKQASVKQTKVTRNQGKGSFNPIPSVKQPSEAVASKGNKRVKRVQKDRENSEESGSEGYPDDFESEHPREAKGRKRPEREAEEYGEDFEPEESIGIPPTHSLKTLQTHEKPVRSNAPPAAKQQDIFPIQSAMVESKKGVVASMRSSKAQALAGDSSGSEGEKEQDRALLAMIKQKVVRGGQTQGQKGEMELMKERRKVLLQQQPRPKSRIDTDEQLFKEIKCENLQEEAEKQRKLLEMLDIKVKSALAEIADLNHEHEAEKEDLLSTVRVKERESGLLYRILEKVLAPEQVSLIKQKSKFDDDNNTWKVPPFLLQPNKPLTFPKLPRRQAQELVETELLSKTLRFPESSERLRSLEGRRRGVSQPIVEENKPRGGDEFPAAMKRSYIS